MAETERKLARGGALDALRFAAAAFITLYHFGGEEAPRLLGDIHPAFGRGFLATDFFLILSGYILARAYGARIAAGGMSSGEFLLRRVARIWPAHLIVLAGFGLVVLAAAGAGLAFNNPESFTWDGFIRQAVFAHAWALGPAPGWNSATWTLSALVVCYAAFPLLWRGVFARVSPVSALALGVAGLAAADLLARAAGADLYTLPPGMGVGRGVPLFVLGVAAARFGQSHAPTGVRGALVASLGAVVLVASQAAPGWTFFGMLGIAAVILAAGAHAPRRPRPGVAYLATLSFSLFITHNLVGLVWFRSLKLSPWTLSEPAAWTAWALIFPVCMAAAVAFHHWVDAPLQAWLKPRLKPRAGAGRARAPLIQPI
jgi:peptidoglycan/LPS O-acetylase OafA/YrhL